MIINNQIPQDTVANTQDQGYVYIYILSITGYKLYSCFVNMTKVIKVMKQERYKSN